MSRYLLVVYHQFCPVTCLIQDSCKETGAVGSQMLPRGRDVMEGHKLA